MFNREEIVTFEKIKNYKKIVLWGAGTYTEELIGMLGKDRIIAIYDSNKNKWGQFICGIEVSDAFESFEEIVDEQTIILISVASYNYEIATTIINRWKIPEHRIFAFTHLFGEKYMYDTESIFINENRIREALSLFADDQSKEYFVNTLRERINRNPLYLQENPRITASYEYTCKNGFMIAPKKGGVILDCGAYIGDTARLFLKRTQNDCKVYAMEPFLGNYDKLCQWVKSENLSDKVYPIQTLLGNDVGESLIRSSTNVSVNSSQDNEGSVSNIVSNNRLDNLLHEKVSFIKMDIEGAEIDALKGAVKIIKQNRPQMIISAYHRTSHIWEIPLLIREIEPTYKIFCGHQMNAAFEPEIYATV